ncbi:MAG: bifunctional demethylmenaquinone methyltransferase/2-methoxy-6-polyprenyl-1,4-benzoquinol methylase UbiE [Micavibrio aeruginosavorus]|uniref:Demethylmenaquinone methyltransferase n=1 Tax=Micavibrio aeruginosavorus TaxID=349221 RepID=A0A2W5FHD2_9BACT|nr:MAG: bifunctional demethylmenaquinone methyltransferase/2-methoxy-6-polyprenyl-1,4-benzoquinol methylase UbiE [Micavibrio aeruginosavorus]
MRNPEQNWFGRQKVDAQEKTQKVLGVFDSVASKYDIMNDLMSGGLHRLWKDRFIREIRPQENLRYLDVAGGTGDIAFRIWRATNGNAPITVSDINASMLKVGRERSINKAMVRNLEWKVANAAEMPFEDDSFDVYTIAFGLRNVTLIDDALKEAYRILKPGGRFFCLEFSHVTEPTLSKVYDAFSFGLIPKMGKIVAKDEESYQYLVESIRAFPKQEDLKQRLLDAGFDSAKYTNLTFGTVAIHEAWKL